MHFNLLPPLLIAIAASLLSNGQGVPRAFPWSPQSTCLGQSVRSLYPYTPPPAGDPPNVYRKSYPPVTLEYGAWVTANLTTYVAAILLNEILNFGVRVNEVPGLATTYTRVAAGNATFNFEVWPNNRQLDYTKYVVSQQTVTDVGPLGYLGAVNWYFPVTLAQQHPDKIIESWRSFFDPTVLALFPPAGTTLPAQLSPGTYLCPMNNSPPCTNGVYIPPQCQPTGRFYGQCRELWHNYPNLNRGESEQIIHDLGLPLVVVYLGDSFYAHVADCVAARNASRSCLVYYWTPDSFHSMFPMDKVALPSYTAACWNAFDVNLSGSTLTSLKCGWPPEALHKIGNAEVLKTNAVLREFVANVKIGDGELKRMMDDVDPNNATSVAAAACKWVREHREGVWHGWIPQPPPVRYAPSSVVSRPDQVIHLILFITGTLFPLFLLLLIHSNHRDIQIRVYSPLLLAMTNVGCILLVLGSSIHLLSLSSTSCNARPWMISLGLLIIQIALAARAWRLYAIINNKQYSVVLFGRLIALRGTNKQVMTVCGLALLIQTLLIVIVRGTQGIDSIPVREFPVGGPADVFYWVCPPMLPNPLQVLIIVPHVLLAIGSMYLARHARRVVSVTADPKRVLVFYAYFSVAVGVVFAMSLTATSAQGMSFLALGDVYIPASLATQAATMHLTAPPFLVILVAKWREWVARLQGYNGANHRVVPQDNDSGEHGLGDTSRALGLSRTTGGGKGAITMALDADETQSMWRDLGHSPSGVHSSADSAVPSKAIKSAAPATAAAGNSNMPQGGGERGDALLAGPASSSSAKPPTTTVSGGNGATKLIEHVKMTAISESPGTSSQFLSMEQEEAFLRSLFIFTPRTASSPGANGHHLPISPQVRALPVPVRYLTRPVGVRPLGSWNSPWIEAHLLLAPSIGMFAILPAIVPGLLKHNHKGWTYWQARGKQPSVTKNAKHPDRIVLLHNGSTRAFELQFLSAAAADRWSLMFSLVFTPPAASSHNSAVKRLSSTLNPGRRRQVGG